MTVLEEYKEDMIISDEHRKILHEFYEAVKIQDKSKAEEQIEKIKELPFLKHKKDVYVPLGDGGFIIGYQTRPWKARDLDKKKLMITEKNEEMHPYLAEFFDIAVRENMTRLEGMLDEFKESASKGRQPLYDGNYEISLWLHEYAETAVLFEQQGKKIIEPQTFQEYPCLKEYSEQRIERVKDKVEEEMFNTLAKEIRERKDGKGNSERIQTLADTLLKYIDNPTKYEKYSKILDLNHIDAVVCDKHFALKVKRLKSIIDSQQEEQEKLRSIIDSQKEQQEKERSNSVNATEDIRGLTDSQKKENFDAKKKLMEEHPIMLEPCLNSMCESYVSTKDKTIKKEMLGDLYAIRKDGKSDAEKREMAKTFKRVLDRNPSLKKDENLVALSKIDTPFAQPTKGVKEQVTR